jgi:flagellar export protein FliJ
MEHRRVALAEANREVRVLEKLRDRQHERHRQEENRQEIKELDEVAGRRAVREEAP